MNVVSMRCLVTSFLLTLGLSAPLEAQELKVRITESLPYVDVMHDGHKVRIQRVQDTNNKLIDDFAKTSRTCPPFCIHPIKLAGGVETYGELELLDFLVKQVRAGSGLLIDSRLPEFYRTETIPGAINVPFSVVRADNPHIDKILTAVGAAKAAGRWDFSGAKSLLMFCNGLWCDQSPKAIESLLSMGYPAEKMKYYRGGMQSWRSLGLTTVVPAKPQ